MSSAVIALDAFGGDQCPHAEVEGAVGAARAGVTGHREYNSGWHTAIDLHNLLTVSEAIAMAAIERKESRGAHFRDDYPGKADEFSTFNFVVEKGSSGEMTLSRAPITPLPPELAKVIEENK